MKALKVKGHKLSMEWSRVRGFESSSTGTCLCGWEEHGSSQRVVRDEYRWHLIAVMAAAGMVQELQEAREAGYHVSDWKMMEAMVVANEKLVAKGKGSAA